MTEVEHQRVSTLGILIADGDLDAAAEIRAACRRLQLGAPDLATTLAQARHRLTGSRLSLLFVDDAWAPDLLELDASREPPAVIVMGRAASGQRAFEYATRGVEAYLDKPLTEAQVIEAMDAVLHGPWVIERIARSLVGRRGLKEIQDSIRRAMFSGALERALGNRHAAARMLGINRRAVQLVAKELTQPYPAAPPSLPGLSAPPPARPSEVQLQDEELKRFVYARVTFCEQDVLLWRDLPVQQQGAVELAFQRIAELAADRESVALVADLTLAAYPSASVRERLYRGFRATEKLRHIAVFTGPNTALGIAARFVLGPHARCAISIHRSYESALEAARQR